MKSKLLIRLSVPAERRVMNMTRTKKRYNAIGRNDSTCGEGGSIYSVALYARLSEDREDHPSESIENQLEIMRRFIKDKP